jgi:hypothetical protein
VNLHNVKVRFRSRTVHLDSHLLANLAELATPGGLGTSSLMPLCYSKEKRILSSRLSHYFLKPFHLDPNAGFVFFGMKTRGIANAIAQSHR